MCSILGMAFFKGHKLLSESTIIGIMSRLFKEAEVGGRSASGLSIMKTTTSNVMRRPLSGSELVGTDEYMDFMKEHITPKDQTNKLMSIIGHCRMPTKGPAANNLNNHPIIADNIIGVHNGVIGNDDETFNKFRKLFTRQAEVDTEIIFQLINQFIKPTGTKTIKAIQKTTSFLMGSYACAVHNNRNPYNLYLFRHSRPIRIRFYPKMGVLFFATRMYFIEQAVDGFLDGENSKGSKDIDLIDDHGIALNMWDTTMCKFNFKDENSTENKAQC